MTTPDPVVACLRGEISPEVTLARLVLSAETATSIRSCLEAATYRNQRWAALHRLATDATVDRLRQVIAAAEVQHGETTTLARIAEQFDRAVATSPEASVAMYSLGDRSILEAATQEIIDWLHASRLIGPNATVLDLGCGIGRVAASLAGHVAWVHGFDVSTAMVREAQRRYTGLQNVSFTATSGMDLAACPDMSCDLVLAVDTFPYLVQVGVAHAHIAESRRVLRRHGHLAVLNLSYRGDTDLDQADAEDWSRAHGFMLQQQAVRPFHLWDAACWTFQRIEASSR